MPTATLTKTPSSTQSVIPLKAGPSSSSPPPPPQIAATPTSVVTSTTLRSLYNRAARAFLHRDITLTHSLLSSAFSILHPPSSDAPDFLTTHRRKWDILRITLETTLYTSPQDANSEALPLPLRESLSQSPHPLINSLLSRSLELFTPDSNKPNVVFLPSQILMTLVLSSLKLDCPDVGRGVIEDWFAQRAIQLYDDNLEKEESSDGYEHVLEIYCLHVLPRLEEWDYAKEFLQYESELPLQKRTHLQTSLETLHSQVLASRNSRRRSPVHPLSRPSSPSPLSTSTSTPSTPTPRSASPAPSSSSSSTSLSTTSTHTAVPRTPRPALPRSALASSTSLVSDKTVTNHRVSVLSNGVPPRARSSSPSHVLRAPRVYPVAAPISAPSPLTLIRASLAPYLSVPKVTTFLVLFVLFPVMSLLLRLRRRRHQITAGGGVPSAAELARRRLAGGGVAGAAGAGIVEKIWKEAVRAVVDVVRMGGRGLV